MGGRVAKNDAQIQMDAHRARRLARLNPGYSAGQDYREQFRMSSNAPASYRFAQASAWPGAFAGQSFSRPTAADLGQPPPAMPPRLFGVSLAAEAAMRARSQRDRLQSAAQSVSGTMGAYDRRMATLDAELAQERQLAQRHPTVQGGPGPQDSQGMDQYASPPEPRGLAASGYFMPGGGGGLPQHRPMGGGGGGGYSGAAPVPAAAGALFGGGGIFQGGGSAWQNMMGNVMGEVNRNMPSGGSQPPLNSYQLYQQRQQQQSDYRSQQRQQKQQARQHLLSPAVQAAKRQQRIAATQKRMTQDQRATQRWASGKQQTLGMLNQGVGFGGPNRKGGKHNIIGNLDVDYLKTYFSSSKEEQARLDAMNPGLKPQVTTGSWMGVRPKTELTAAQSAAQTAKYNKFNKAKLQKRFLPGEDINKYLARKKWGKGVRGDAARALFASPPRARQAGGGRGGQLNLSGVFGAPGGGGGSPFGFGGNLMGNQIHQANLAGSAGVAQLRQRAAASGRMENFGGQAAQFLGTQEQGRQNAMLATRQQQSHEMAQQQQMAMQLAQLRAMQGPGYG